MSCKLAAIVLLIGLALSGGSALGECALLPKTTPEKEKAGLCGFDAARRAFSGSAAEQATCLLQNPTIGRSAVTAVVIPHDFLVLVGTPTTITTKQLHAYLQKQKIDEVDVGGTIDEKISADYFIIHDTSAPNCSVPKACPVAGQFPPDIDRETWAGNVTFNGHKSPNAPKVSHVMTNRVGQSITEVNFKLHKSTTKFEYCLDGVRKRSLFVGVENIQPRISTSDKKLNDFIAPDSGFTDAQYKRLAQLYVVASIRRGQWLIPANHAVLDWYYVNGHDDPQHFDVAQFGAKVIEVAKDMASRPMAT
jgi:hypothetical protein